MAPSEPDEVEQGYLVAVERGDPEANVKLGDYRLERGDLDGAEQAYRDGIEKGDPEAGVKLADLLARQGAETPRSGDVEEPTREPSPRFRRMLSPTTPAPLGEDVRQLQEWLVELGFTPVGTDGVYGPETVAAVRRFQEAIGLVADGVVGPATWAALEVSPSVRHAAANLEGEVAASALVAEILKLHGEYGDGRGSSVVLDTDQGERASAEMWLDRVRRLVDPAVAPRLHGRLVTAALARVDRDLRRQLARDGFLAAVEGEIQEPLDRLFGDRPPVTPRAEPGDEAFDFVPSAAADLPSTDDVLGFKPLVSALYALLDDERTVLPLAVAVTAPWGAGKSSVMRQLRGLLDDPPSEPAPFRRWHTVAFDAWKYERSERLWAALAKAIYDQAQERMSLSAKLWFRVRLEWRRLPWWNFGLKILWPPLAAAAAVIAALSVDLDDPGPAVAALSAVAAAFAAIGRYWTMITNPFKQAIERYTTRPDYQSQLGFTTEADHDIRCLTSVLCKAQRDGLAVFVDDLDRCSSAHVVEVVEAMNQIFNSAERNGCVFVLGLDREIVATNIDVAYGATVEKLKLAENPLGDDFGLQFLAKLVQMSVAIPEPDDTGIAALLARVTGNEPPRAHPPPEGEPSEEEIQRAEKMIESEEPASLAEISDVAAKLDEQEGPPGAAAEAGRRQRAERIKDSGDVIAAEFLALKHLQRNPRQIKRFHNAFRLQLYVANEDDRLKFDFTGDQLIALARWVALRLRWPTLADDIDDEPWLLQLLEAEANHEGPPVAASQHDCDRIRQRYKRWFGDRRVLEVMRERNDRRRLSALPLESFLRVA